MKQDELKKVYKEVFNTSAGKQVFYDLYRIANQSRIDQDAPNPYAAIFKIAQQSLLKRIENMCDLDRTETTNIIERR
jgi:hypothetical protein